MFVLFFLRDDFTCDPLLPVLNLAAFYTWQSDFVLLSDFDLGWVTVDIRADMLQYIFCNCCIDANVTRVASVIIPSLRTVTCCQELPVQK